MDKMGQKEIKNNVRKKWDGKMDGMDGWTEDIDRIDGGDGWAGGINRMDGLRRWTGWMGGKDGCQGWMD